MKCGSQMIFVLALLGPLVFGQSQEKKSERPEYYDEPQFTVAGMADYTYRGGHGSDMVLRSTEELTKATAELGHVDGNPANALAAVRAYQHAAELDPNEPNLFHWGAELLEHHAVDPAIEVFTKGNRLFPRSSRMLLGLATGFYARGSYDDAARRFFEAADLNPSDPEPYLFLGKVQAREITELNGYLERLRRFAKIQPSNAQANYYYAVALWNHRRNEDEVKRLINKAIELDPHLGVAYLQLGIVYADQKNLPSAIAAYRKAIEVDSQLEEAHYRLSQEYAMTGEKAEAEKELALYRELSKRSAAQRERDRAELKQFVIELKSH